MNSKYKYNEFMDTVEFTGIFCSMYSFLNFFVGFENWGVFLFRNRSRFLTLSINGLGMARELS